MAPSEVGLARATALFPGPWPSSLLPTPTDERASLVACVVAPTVAAVATADDADDATIRHAIDCAPGPGRAVRPDRGQDGVTLRDGRTHDDEHADRHARAA